jgi:hypothetical protein
MEEIFEFFHKMAPLAQGLFRIGFSAITSKVFSVEFCRKNQSRGGMTRIFIRNNFVLRLCKVLNDNCRDRP